MPSDGTDYRPAGGLAAYNYSKRVDNSGMGLDGTRGRLQEAGLSAYRATVLASAFVIVLCLFAGMAYLVSEGLMEAGALILFSGVILGYTLRSLKDII